MTPTARVRLLGRLEINLDGRPDGASQSESPRAEALVAYLLLHRARPVPRGRVAGLFWPESTEAQARTNLRHLVHTLRTRVPGADRWVEVTPTTLRWRSEEPCLLDVEEFERLLAVGGEPALRAAVALYAGDLMEGHDDEWLRPERDRLRRRYLDALAALSEAQGDLAEAISTAERLVRSDPLHEEHYRRLMRLHAARGDRAKAMGVYHDCSSTLERELGVAPAASTRAAYAALLTRERAAPGPAAAPDAGPALVGRATERARLAAAWRATEAGRAQFVVLTGEPGVGKTRLTDEFRGWCARRGAVVADARCYAAEGPLAYGPIASWLRSPALRSTLAGLDPHRRTELSRLLPELIDETAALERPEPLAEPEQRQRFLDAVAVAVAAPPRAVLLVVDDLQHVDAETCQVVHYVLRARPTARLLVVATARAEELDDGHPLLILLAALRADERCVELELARLDRAETARLAAALSQAPLTGSDLDRLYTETDGNPLFVVEAVRAGPAPGETVSPRVQAVIESRLAQLPAAARELAETAALIGRGFGIGVLAAASGVDEDALVTGLDELWRRRIIRQRGANAYDFSHDAIRDVATGRIGPAHRRRLHRRIAEVLERGHDGDPDAVAGQIATHLAHAGSARRAAVWFLRAARAVQLLHADTQAVALTERALEQLRELPASPDRDAAELEARMALLAPLTSARGYASPALSATQERARELAARLGREPAPALLRAQAMTAATRGDSATAMRIGDQLLAAGDRAGDGVLVVEGAFLQGVTAFWAADFRAAQRYLRLAVERYRPADRRAHLVHYGNDPKVACLARLGNTLWFLGRPDTARAASTAALAWAEEIGHGYSRGIALWFGALLALDMGDEERLRAHTAELAAVASVQLELGTAALRGYLTVRDGDAAGGVAAVRAAIERGRGREAPGLQACLHRILLAACLAGDDATAAAAVAEVMLGMGGGAQVWSTVARRAAGGRSLGSPSVERSRNAAARTLVGMTNDNPILVTGATGTVGRHLVHLLRSRGVPVRAFVRDPEAAIRILGADTDLAVGDFGDPASLRAAVAGVEQVYLACGNHPLQTQLETAAIDAAVAAGVRRIVKLSVLGAAIGSPIAFSDAHGRIVEHLAASGVDHVLLEPAFNMANLMGAADGVRHADSIFLPAQGAKIAMIDPRDVAEVAAVVLTAGDVHDGRRYELTGPAAVTLDDVAEAMSSAVGRRIGFVPVPDDVALAQVIAAGAPEWFATNLVRIFEHLRAGALAETRDVFRALTGREPSSVAQFLHDHAGAFA